MSSNDLPELEWLNKSELLELLRKPGFGGYRLRHDLSTERLIHLVRTGETPHSHELAVTSKTRAELQAWIASNGGVITQLPCQGPDRAKCTIYPCPDSRHASCWLKSKGHRI